MSILPLFIFFLYYSVGVLALFFWRKQQLIHHHFFFQSSWLAIAVAGYAATLESLHGSWFFFIPLACILLFLYLQQRKRAALRNGFFFLVTLGICGLYLVYNFYRTNDFIVLSLFGIALVLLLLLAIFGVFALLVFLYWNSVVILKREKPSLANLLTLILALFLTVYYVLTFFLGATAPWYIRVPLDFLSSLLLYFWFNLVLFFTASLLYQVYFPPLRQDFMIVLGAGLINGERVTPLLAQRIDRAIAFYRLQQQKTGHPLKFILSGGQGPDEKISEALAMKQYALSQGIPANAILLEERSTTTLENMRFSKALITKHGPAEAKVLFSSNNYHIFRAGIYAQQAGLTANGIGSHTAFYYLPNAFLREFAAIFLLHKTVHLVILALLSLISIGSFIGHFF